MFIQWKFRITSSLMEQTDPTRAITMKGWAIRKAQHIFRWDILPRGSYQEDYFNQFELFQNHPGD